MRPMKKTHPYVVFLFIVVCGIAAFPAVAQISLSDASPAPLPEAGPQLTVATATETNGAHPGDTLRALAAVTLSEGWHVNANKPLDEFTIPTVLSFEAAPQFDAPKMFYPAPQKLTFSFSPDPVLVYGSSFLIGMELRILPETPPGDYLLKGKLKFQACNNKQCALPRDADVPLKITVLPAETAKETSGDARFASIEWTDAANAAAPETATAAAPVETGGAAPLPDNFTVVRTFAGFLRPADFIAALEGKEPVNALTGKSLLLVLLIVLGGGFLLNLTPCVLPLIPINIAIIGAGAKAGSKMRGFLLGLAYGLGIASVYGALGLVVVLGVSSAFGNINATWWFNAAIAALFIVLGLAMFDLIAIDFSKYQAAVGLRKNERGSFLVAAAMGAISALLAGACVAPVVFSTILYAQDLYSQGKPLALALPFLLGAGMALPWPFLGAGMSFLPKQGMWMVRVKQVFAVFFLVLAAYYAYESYRIFAPAKEELAAGWTDSLEKGLEQARAEHKPVFVDLWATWCKNCLAMDAVTFNDPKVVAALDGYVKVKFQMEDLTAPEVSAFAKRLGVVGLPTYAVLQPE